jgi:hypothetical protein
VDGSYFGSAPEAVLDDEAGLAPDGAGDDVAGAAGAAEDDVADAAVAVELPPLELQAPTPATSAAPKIIGIQNLRIKSPPVFSVPPSICWTAKANVRHRG